MMLHCMRMDGSGPISRESLKDPNILQYCVPSNSHSPIRADNRTPIESVASISLRALGFIREKKHGYILLPAHSVYWFSNYLVCMGAVKQHRDTVCRELKRGPKSCIVAVLARDTVSPQRVWVKKPCFSSLIKQEV